MKKLKSFFVMTLIAIFVSCGTSSCGDDDKDNPGGNSGGSTSQNGGNVKPEESIPVTGTIVGDINTTTWTAGEESSVQLSGIPGSYADFKDLQSQIGGTPQGAATLVLVAMEMYHQRGATVGLKCLEEVATPSTITPDLKDRLKELFTSSDPNYARPYQVAAFLKGASPENGYNPTKPYTVETYVDNVPFEDSELLNGTVITLRVKYSGSQTSKDVRVQVVKPYGKEYYIASTWNSYYVRVRKIANGTTYNGL